MKTEKIFIGITILIAVSVIVGSGLLLSGNHPDIQMDNQSISNPIFSDGYPSFQSELFNISIKTSSRIITVNTTIRKYPSTFPVYWAVIRENDTFSSVLSDTTHPKHNVTSTKDAPDVAKKILEGYGGLPYDAEVVWSGSDYSYLYSNSGELLSKDTILTSVVYGRKLNGLSFDGDTDYIRVELGENSQPLTVTKLWRNLTEIGNISIIPAREVIRQLTSEDVLDQDRLILECGTDKPVEIEIDTIVLRYYETGGKEIYVEPVWVLIGKIKNGSDPQIKEQRIKFVLNARQHVDFTVAVSVTPVAGPITSH